LSASGQRHLTGSWQLLGNQGVAPLSKMLQPVGPNVNSTLTVSAGSAAPGTYPVTITATTGSTIHSYLVNFQIN